MTATIFLLLGNPESRIWVTLITLMIVVIGYFANRLTKGYTVGYVYSSIGEGAARTLMIIHGFGSLIIALALPNNYLNEIPYFNQLYKTDELWIAASMLGMLFVSIIVLGVIFTLAVKTLEKYISDDQES